MSPQQVSLVQASWQKVVPIADTAAGLFYGRLFELDPELKHLFKSDISEQGRKLMAMISTVVAKLDSLGDIVPAVQDLGRRHVAYGVEAQHYDTVGAALLWTLEKGLGDAFTPEVKEAWTVAYTTLAGAMKEAAAEAI
ncbi:globin family protein [Uliginosibacterium sp. H3]|uniref:Globin family protein n=1 Tax=Uliginosibacterium silvisoli TaxID=3114758 RepID=A0ABU6K2Y6_9RHOO|nr:globin family protein [Uliginosibacterium sp. H3]